MLAALGRTKPHAAFRLRKAERLSQHTQRIEVRGWDLLDHPEMLDLRIREYLIDRIDGTAWNAGVVQRVEPMCGARGSEQPLDVLVCRVAIFQTQFGSSEGRIRQQFP